MFFPWRLVHAVDPPVCPSIGSLPPTMNTMSCHIRSLARIRPLVAVLTLVAGILAVTPRALASAIPSTAIVSESSRSSDLSTIRHALEQKQVQQRLGELGFTDSEIQQRLANASDSELHQLATQSQAVMAGGDGGVIVTVLLIILLVMVIVRIK